ncbi:MAG TPA: hypothetical protein VGG16_07120 [Streptosporangiaceae bacterium]|jgi:hypothetical protein
MARAEFIKVQKALGGISCPATKDQLIISKAHHGWGRLTTLLERVVS